MVTRAPYQTPLSMSTSPTLEQRDCPGAGRQVVSRRDGRVDWWRGALAVACRGSARRGARRPGSAPARRNSQAVDAQAAEGHGLPRVMVTGKLRSYAAANTTPSLGIEHRQHKGLNNRAENSYQPTRVCEKVIRRFKSAASCSDSPRFTLRFRTCPWAAVVTATRNRNARPGPRRCQPGNGVVRPLDHVSQSMSRDRRLFSSVCRTT